MSLFAGAQAAGPRPLVEFKAGKMIMQGNMVKPDKRKGLIQLIQSPEDGLMHFQWKDRTTGTVDDDLMIFPDEAKWVRVDKCTTGRVYLLDFNNSDRKLFFWMQEPKTDKDEEYARKINDYINNPPPPQQAGGGLGGLAGLAGAGGLEGLDHRQQLLALLSGFQPPAAAVFAPGTGVPGQVTSPDMAQTHTTQSSDTAPPMAGGPAPASGHPHGGQLQLSMLENILQNITGVQGAGAQGGAAAGAGAGGQQQQQQPQQQQQQQQQQEGPSLREVLNADAIINLLRQDESMIDRLVPYLPHETLIRDPTTGKYDLNAIAAHIRSPQFRQTIELFNHTLQTGEFIALASSFGLDPMSVIGGTGPFLNALQSQADREREEAERKAEEEEEEEAKREFKKQSKNDPLDEPE